MAARYRCHVLSIVTSLSRAVQLEAHGRAKPGRGPITPHAGVAILESKSVCGIGTNADGWMTTLSGSSCLTWCPKSHYGLRQFPALKVLGFSMPYSSPTQNSALSESNPTETLSVMFVPKGEGLSQRLASGGISSGNSTFIWYRPTNPGD